MDGESTLERGAVVSLAALGCAGLLGWIVAASGHPMWGFVAWVLGTAGGVWASIRFQRPALARTLAELTRDVDDYPDHPQAPLLAEIRDLMGRVEGHGRAVRDVVRKLQEHATLIAWVVDTLNQAVSRARNSLGSMQGAMGHVGEHAGEVLRASHQGGEFIKVMGTSTEELFESAETLNRSVEDATASVVQIHGALAGVQHGVHLLSEASDRTTEFIAQVGEAMGGIRERVEQSLNLSHKVEASARRGREVVVGVGEGVGAIRQSSEAMVQAVQALGTQSHEIEGVLGIITDVAEETSLLSLNAAILAAQAGEKGAAFGVVADQIRSLARRTRESTKHIEELVRGIQANIAEANQGLTASLNAVEEGEEMGREAVRQLGLVEEAVADSVDQAGQISQASQEQDEKARTMVSAAGEVNDSLHQVAENLSQSIQEMDRINALIQSLAGLSHSVHAATENHRETGWKTAELMGSFSGQVAGIDTLLEKQRETASDLEAALASVTESSESTQESRTTLHSIVNELVEQFDDLREEVGRLLVTREEEHESSPEDAEPEPSVDLFEALPQRSE
jgi:methyl-accepting chemotaxis protein